MARHTQNACIWSAHSGLTPFKFLLPVSPARSLPAEGERRQSRDTGLGAFRLGTGLDTGPHSDLALLAAHGPHGPANLTFKKWQCTLIFLPGKSHGGRSLAGYTVHEVARSRT